MSSLNHVRKASPTGDLFEAFIAGTLLVAALLSFTACERDTAKRSVMNVAAGKYPDEFDPFPRHLAAWRAPVGPGTPWNSKDKRSHYFVGLAISGGGSRSAVFSASVLEELERIGLLQETYAISSVSGGSLTSAYYLLNPSTEKAEYWNKFRETVGQDLLTPWLRKMDAVNNIARTAFTANDRSDLMADVMDQRIFHGATFAKFERPFHLGSSPLLLINATLVSNTADGAVSNLVQMPMYSGPSNRRLDAGDTFVFTAETLASFGSDISDMRLADAVMTSGAFPGVFNTRTLADYEFGFTQKEWQGEKERPDSFIHLIDGGPSDNLGIDTLGFAAVRWHNIAYNSERDGVRPVSPSSKYKGCLLVLVDAATGALDDSSSKEDPRKPVVDFIVDTNAMQAIDAMMKRRRFDTLRSFGIDMRKEGAGHGPRFVEHVSMKELREQGFFVADDANFPYLECSVWHIALDRIDDIKDPKRGRELTSEEVLSRLDEIMAMLEAKQSAPTKEWPGPNYLPLLANAAETVATNYKLTSPRCSSEKDIEVMLRAAARELVLGDPATLQSVCHWMAVRGLQRAGQCSTVVHERIPLPKCVEPPLERGRGREFEWFDPQGRSGDFYSSKPE